ncbi:allantoate permease [Lophiostoma macrostomum CBS 122681]|uniref:Allantoate permease n=1 Tax=Lophiostoma macrostomum CBS 122681 TaxID=1314788 RepID=A0A6A6SGV7_9PLEO|nr:allantoate permease [Lophiostoma macrostomum CBS 122681]
MADIEKTQEARHENVHSDAESANKLAAVDTLHNDEATKVLAGYSGPLEWDDQEETRLRRKIDWRLMPVLITTYGLQYYDKAMLGQAALFGLRTELHLLVGNRYSMAAAIFYLGFIVGAYPLMMLVQKYPIERVASILVAVWGACLICTPACTNYKGLYAQRFFLGFLESGISPAFMLVVGSFYKKQEQALRMGLWYCATGYVSVFSPLVNYGLGQIHGSLESWKYMYLFAGAVTIVWGIFLFWTLMPDPVRTKAFNERERYIAVARLRTNNSGVRNTHIKLDQIIELLLDVKFWLLFAIAFLSMIANGAISSFLPIVIESLGHHTALQSLLLVMPAGAVAGTLQLALPYLAMKTTNLRIWLFLFAQSLTVLACFLLWLLPFSATGALLFACYILPGVGAGYAVLMGVQVANTAGYTKRAIASAGLFIGYAFGNFAGPLLFKPKDAPQYNSAFAATTVTAIVAAVCGVLYRYACVWDNKKRDKAGVMEAFEHAYEDDLTDKKNPQFRYIL